MRLKILAVDDEAPIRKWLSYCISKQTEFLCIPASSAQEAIKLYTEERPDIILTDIEMPGMNGLDMLRQIQKMDPDCYHIILTSHEQFDYARAAMAIGSADYILKTELTEQKLGEILRQALRNIQKRRSISERNHRSKEDYLRSLALRQDKTVAEEELKEREIEIPKTGYVVYDMIFERQEILREGLRYLQGQPGVSEVFPYGDVHLMVIAEAGQEGKQMPAMENGMAEGGGERRLLQLRLWQLLYHHCGISGVHYHQSELGMAIGEAQIQSLLYFYRPEQELCDLKYQKTLPDYEHFQIAFLRLLLEQKFKDAFKQLTDFAEVLRQTQPLDLRMLRSNFTSALLLFSDFCGLSEPSDEALIQGIESKQTFDEMFSFIVELIRPYIKGNPDGLTLQMTQAIAFIEEHYCEKLSLGEVAEYVGFSSEHFSRVFTKETGINFSTYVNNVRMKRAAYLLETTSQKVYEIAEEVGFSSLSYFSTTFKKKFGKNPYEYQIEQQRGRERIYLN